MTPWRSSRLCEDHITSEFDCGQESLNQWLADQAMRAERAGVSATTVWTPAGEQRVVAYYSITPTVVRRDEQPTRAMAGGYTSVPGYLLGRRVLDRGLHGQGHASQLLIDAIERIVSAAALVGGRVILVDAIDEAAATFYEHHDFTRIIETKRLVMKIATARRALLPPG